MEKQLIKNLQVQLEDFLLANLLPKHKDIKFSLIDRLLPKRTVSEIIDIVFRFTGQKIQLYFVIN